MSSPYRFSDRYAEELALCLQLFAQAEQANVPLDVEREGDVLLFRIAARATKTFRAVMHLCHLGHGEQATMLNRALFEDVITAHWVNLNPDLAVERLRKHERHTAVLWRDHMIERGIDPGALAELPDLTDAERADLEALFGARGDRRWTGLSAYRTLKAIEGAWGDADSKNSSGICTTFICATRT